jgi:hypothetical protein
MPPLPKSVPKWLYAFMEYVVQKEKNTNAKNCCTVLFPQYLNEYWEPFKERELRKLEKKQQEKEAEGKQKKPPNPKKGFENALSKYQQYAAEAEAEEADDIKTHFREQLEQLPEVLKSAVMAGGQHAPRPVSDENDSEAAEEDSESRKNELAEQFKMYYEKANELYKQFSQGAKEKHIEQNDPLHQSVDQLHQVVVHLTGSPPKK